MLTSSQQRSRAPGVGTKHPQDSPATTDASPCPKDEGSFMSALCTIETNGIEIAYSEERERAASYFGRDAILMPSPPISIAAQENSRCEAGRSSSVSSISSEVSLPYRALKDFRNLDGTENASCISDASHTSIAKPLPRPSGSAVDVTASSPRTARKRGRPPKEGLGPTVRPSKGAKIRTRTGCITCRKRKKKCTEEKPVCSNCQRINYVCTYPETEIYKTGSEKANEGDQAAQLSVPRSLPSLFEGVVSSTDRRLLHHFIHICSPTLSFNTNGQNLYLVHFIPMAAAHGPLMHAILALSASHLSFQAKLRDQAEEPNLVDYQVTLHSRAIRGMRQELTELQGSINEQIVAINLLTILYTAAQGQTNGEYHQHVAAAKTMSGLLQSENGDLCDFIYENVRYYATSSTLLSGKGHNQKDLSAPIGRSKSPTAHLIGVYCGSLKMLDRISRLRIRVREILRQRGRFQLESTMYAEAADIDIDLHEWEPSAPRSSSRWLVGKLCQRASWAYLRRTMTYPSPGPEIKPVLEDAIDLFNRLPENDSAYVCLLYPFFLLGCCAFEETPRGQISSAFDRIRDYTGMRNAQIAKYFIENLWDKMDRDVYAAWEWEQLAQDLKMDFLLT